MDLRVSKASMVYPLVGLLFTCSVCRVSSVIELSVNEDSLNNMFGDLGDESTVVVEACTKICSGFGKKISMEIGYTLTSSLMIYMYILR
jgi:hypothetical protein